MKRTFYYAAIFIFRNVKMKKCKCSIFNKLKKEYNVKQQRYFKKTKSGAFAA
jgi:hypothetical protein